MKILVINGSPRPDGNTAALAEAFREGAKSAGHDVTVIAVAQKKIGACLGCEYCHTRGRGNCVQKDGMTEVYAAMSAADMIVLASPVHYWSFSGQMQSVITRFYAPYKPKVGKYALILSSGSDEVYDAPISQYKSILEYFGAEDMGIYTFFGENQCTEENLKCMRSFGASL